MSKVHNPSYKNIVEPILRANNGDVKELLRLYPCFNAASYGKGDGYPYIIMASIENHLHSVQGLVKCGANVQQKGGMFNTQAITWACAGDDKSRVKLVEWMIEQDKNDSQYNILDLLYEAIINGNPPLVYYLLRHENMFLEYNDLHEGLDDVFDDRAYDHRPSCEVNGLISEAQRRLSLDEWRPWNHKDLPRSFRKAVSTLLQLGKSFYKDG